MISAELFCSEPSLAIHFKPNNNYLKNNFFCVHFVHMQTISFKIQLFIIMLLHARKYNLRI